MSQESFRPTPRTPSTDHDQKIEELLLTGLDCYFEGEYEQAITVWTRVLFLDRGHARARAYIERARGAVGERQRESEELLHRGLAALDRGEVGAARELLRSAIERGGAREDAVAVLERVARLEAAGGVPDPSSRVARGRRPADVATPRSTNRSRRWLIPVSGLAVALLSLGGYYVWTSWSDLRQGFLAPRPAVGAPSMVAREDPLPQPTIGEVTLARGRALYERGRLHDALERLDEIGPADPLREQADELRATIHELLLNTVPSPGGDAGGAAQ